jgi:phosphoribosylanthranilate isomerase
VTRIKICGITRVEDALLASDLGAFALGFVFWPKSPRAVDIARARTIVEALPAHVLKVGVFVDQPVEEVKDIAVATSLDAIQLHGQESPDYIRQFERPVFKSMAVSPSFVVEQMDEIPSHATVLLDAHDPVKRGGTGRIIDWTLAAAAAARRPVILSGGITPDNVRPAVAAVRPFAIDVSSGVERSPGVKDAERLRSLFNAVLHD